MVMRLQEPAFLAAFGWVKAKPKGTRVRRIALA
jgi:hypothetical protein